MKQGILKETSSVTDPISKWKYLWRILINLANFINFFLNFFWPYITTLCKLSFTDKKLYSLKNNLYRYKYIKNFKIDGNFYCYLYEKSKNSV